MDKASRTKRDRRLTRTLLVKASELNVVNENQDLFFTYKYQKKRPQVGGTITLAHEPSIVDHRGVATPLAFSTSREDIKVPLEGCLGTYHGFSKYDPIASSIAVAFTEGDEVKVKMPNGKILTTNISKQEYLEKLEANLKEPRGRIKFLVTVDPEI